MSDESQLQKLGYRQELKRTLSGFSNFAISFSVISILTGGITLYGYGLQTAGPRGIMVGWLLVSLASLPIVFSMAEMASAFPTAGALYHWASLLGNRRLGWFTAWLNYLGQFAITAGIDYGLAEFLVPLLGYAPEGPAKLWIYAGVLISHGWVNHFGIRWVALCNDISAWYHILGVAVLIGALAWLAPLQPVAFLGTASTTTSYPYLYAVCLGLLQAQWTISGYDASAHVAEETVDVSRKVASGMILSVVSSAVLGFIMLVFITLAIRDLAQARAAANPFIHIMTSALGEKLGTAMVWLCVVAMWFCGLSSLTSNSRMLYAFARDGGVPYHHKVAYVSTRHQTPVYAIWISALLAFGLALYGKAYAVVVATSTVFIFLSYFISIAVAWRAQRTGRWTTAGKGSFQLRRYSQLCNAVACVWLGLVVVLFVLPPNYLTLYATLALLLGLVLLYFFYGKHYAGMVKAKD